MTLIKKYLTNTFSGMLLLSSLCLSCKPPYTSDAAGMAELETDLIDKFGKDAYYTYISYLRLDENAYGVNVQVSEDKESIQQQIWLYDAGSWVNTGPMTMQISANTPGFYKYQIGQEVSVKKLGELIEISMDDFKKNGKGQEPVLMNAVVNSNNTVTDANTKYRYTVILKEKGGGNSTTHSYTYGKNGDLLNSN